jgi:DNA modification methylase
VTATNLQGDCVEVMRTLPENSVDAVVTDPPYGLEFMGKEWDRLGGGIGETTDTPDWYGRGAPPFGGARNRIRYGSSAASMQEWHESWAREALRVLKPGGHLLAFGGTRTSHRMVCAIEDAGFEIRDTIVWLYGSGFPKNHDVSKAIDKMAGAEREVAGLNLHAAKRTGHGKQGVLDSRGPGLGGIESAQITVPATPEAEQWEGWGTALKPAHEPIVVARKPLIGTVAANVLTHGTGALNIDGCRIGTTKRVPGSGRRATDRIYGTYGAQDGSESGHDPNVGRWPANVVLDEEAGELLDAQSGMSKSTGGRAFQTTSAVYGEYANRFEKRDPGFGDTGGASRFFYCAKASRSERGEGNNHPTVKPLALMQWLVRLVTPPNGTVLDPFAGSGTTLLAAVTEGFNAIGIEREEEYIAIVKQRLSQVQPRLDVA